MTIAWSAGVQNITTSAPKLDLPLSQLTMGCWDAITIKARTPLHYHYHSMYTPHHPWPPSTSPKNHRFFALVQFPPNSSIVSCTFGALWGAGIPQFKYIWWNWMWMRVGTFVYVFVMCHEQHVFPFIPQRPMWDMVDASQVPLSYNPAGLRPLWFSTFFSPCSLLSLSLSLIIFSILIWFRHPLICWTLQLHSKLYWKRGR